ncbi:MAG: hypothetical protein ABIA92_04870 [Patescibacteria group bacterium]
MKRTALLIGTVAFAVFGIVFLLSESNEQASQAQLANNTGFCGNRHVDRQYGEECDASLCTFNSHNPKDVEICIYQQCGMQSGKWECNNCKCEPVLDGDDDDSGGDDDDLECEHMERRCGDRSGVSVVEACTNHGTWIVVERCEKAYEAGAQWTCVYPEGGYAYCGQVSGGDGDGDGDGDGGGGGGGGSGGSGGGGGGGGGNDWQLVGPVSYNAECPGKYGGTAGTSGGYKYWYCTHQYQEARNSICEWKRDLYWIYRCPAASDLQVAQCEFEYWKNNNNFETVVENYSGCIPINRDGDDDSGDDDDNSDDNLGDMRIARDEAKETKTQAYEDYTSAKEDAWEGYQSAKADARGEYEDARSEARATYDSDKTTAQEAYYSDAKDEARSEYDQAKLEARADYDEAKASALSAYNTVRENYNDARQASLEAWETYKQDRTEENYTAYLEAKADLESAKEERTEAYEQYGDARVEAQSAFAQTRDDARAAYTVQREQAREVYEEAREEIKNTYEQSRTDARSLYDQTAMEARSEYEDTKQSYYDAYLEAKAAYEDAKEAYNDARNN